MSRPKGFWPEIWRLRDAVRLLVAVAGVISATGAWGQVTKAPGGYLFRMKFEKGKTYSYSIHSEVAASNSKDKMKVTGPFTTRITAVNGDVGTVHITLGPLTSQGQRQPAQKLDMLLNTRGQRVGGTSSSVLQMNVVFPDQPVKPGMSWTGESAVGGGMSATAVRATYKFVGIKLVRGRRVAQLSVTLTSPQSSGIQGTSDVLVLVSDGSTWSITSNSRLRGGGRGAGITMQTSMTRLQ